MINQLYYHLHREFVTSKSTKKNASITATLCSYCFDSVVKRESIPKYSIAGGVDFGNPDRLGLPPLTFVEHLVISLGEEMANVFKLRGVQNAERQAAFTGNIISFRKPNDKLIPMLQSQLTRNVSIVLPRPSIVEHYFSVVFIGARVDWDMTLIATHFKVKGLEVRTAVIYMWLKAKKALDPLYNNIEIDESPEMIAALEAIPRMLIDTATIINEDMENAIESLISEEMPKNPAIQCENQETEETRKSDSLIDDNSELMNLPAVFITRSQPGQQNETDSKISVLKGIKIHKHF